MIPLTGVVPPRFSFGFRSSVYLSFWCELRIGASGLGRLSPGSRRPGVGDHLEPLLQSVVRLVPLAD